MTRQLILCCDGTNNNLTGAAHDTHVVRIAELLARDPDAERLVFYDPGVGHAATLPGGTLWEQLKLWRDRVNGLAFGQGVFDNIVECYCFLMQHYRPGDQLFFFGFSRGAFTARSVAGMVNLFGIPAATHENMLPTLLHLYFSQRGDAGQFDAVSGQARTLFVPPERRQVPVHFVGVWDTVASVGLWPFGLRFTARPVAAGKAFVHVRHALALDEHRAPFEPRLYEDRNGPMRSRDGQSGSMKQFWFRGAHADVGGGYPWHEAGAAEASLGWMLSEALACGLRLRAGDQPLQDEDDVLRALTARQGPRAEARPMRLQLHDELAVGPSWALIGQRLRAASLGEEHSSVAAQSPVWPQDTVWSQRRSRPIDRACWALLPLLWLWMGVLLTGFGRGGPGDWAQFQAQLGAILAAPTQYALWQLSAGWLPGPRALGQPTVLSALWVELGFIACYALLLARGLSHAFARAAGLRRLGQAADPLMQRLGLALPLLVGADLLETGLTALSYAFVGSGLDWLTPVLRVLIVPIAVAKFVALGACALLAWRGLRGPG